MLWSQQHAALDFFWQLVSPLPTMDRVWCWDAMTQRCLSMLGHLSVPDAHLIQHESMWVPFWNFSFFENIHLTSPFSMICSFWRTKFNKSITEDKFNLIALLYFTLFLPRSHNFLSLRTPPWHCGSLVLCLQHLRLDCLSGASSLDWPSEGWHPVGTATSKSRCVCFLCGRARMLDWWYCDVCLSESVWFNHKHLF